MRLICPNCEAQYEVDDNVIPEAGRDVQCSNCSNTWFQAHPSTLEPKTKVEAPAAAPIPEVSEDTVETPEESVADAPQDAPPAAPERRKLDDTLADILRQEAEREAEARKSEGQPAPLESQPDLGLDSALPEPTPEPEPEPEQPAPEDTEPEEQDDALQDRISQLRDTVPDSFGAPADGPRRDLLPDIEEINSTLSASGQDVAVVDTSDASVQEGVPTPAPGQDRGFSRGFSIVILLAAVAVGIYVFAGKIAEFAPSLEPYLAQYVAIADQLRLNFHGMITRGMAWMTEFLQGINGS